MTPYDIYAEIDELAPGATGITSHEGYTRVAQAFIVFELRRIAKAIEAANKTREIRQKAQDRSDGR